MPTWQIVISGPGYFDTQYDLPEGDTHLGRADENDVVLTGDKVSRRHARIHTNSEQVTLEDLGSRNGTQLNGKAISQVVPLKDGDRVSVGENTLVLRQPSEAENARTEVFDPSKHSNSNPGTSANPLSVNADSGEIDLAKHIAELAGQVVMTRDLRQNSFIASFEQASKMSVEEIQQAAPAGSSDGQQKQALMLLYKVVDTLSRAPTLDAYMQQTLDMVMELSKAKTGVVLLRNVKGSFSPVVVRHSEKLEKGEVPISDAIVAEVVQKKVALCVADVKDDARFNTRESVILYDVNQVLCVPMQHDGAIIGLIYLNRQAGPPDELAGLLDLLTAIAQLSANGAQQARLKAKVQNEERVRRALERFHAPDVIDRVVKDLTRGGQLNAKIDELTATVIFADMSNFTQLLGKLPGPRVLDLLNEFYRCMSRVIFSYGGTVDKFMGDAVMALFGAPYSRGDDATRAVRASLAMRQNFVVMMGQRKPDERCGIKIALHTGPVLAGVIGSDARLEYTALGEPVNVAAKLEESAAPGQVLITQATLDAVGDRFQTQNLGERVLKGKTGKLVVYEVVDEEMNWATSPGVSSK